MTVPNSRGKNITLLMLIYNRGAPLYRIFEGACNAAILQDFLEHLVLPWFAGLPPTTRRRIVIMDNVRFHHSQIVKDVFTGDVVQKFLPPYSPQLNPIEEVFGVLKSHFKNMKPRPDTKRDLCVRLTALLETWQTGDVQPFYSHMRTWLDVAYNGHPF